MWLVYDMKNLSITQTSISYPHLHHHPRSAKYGTRRTRHLQRGLAGGAAFSFFCGWRVFLVSRETAGARAAVAPPPTPSLDPLRLISADPALASARLFAVGVFRLFFAAGRVGELALGLGAAGTESSGGVAARRGCTCGHVERVQRRAVWPCVRVLRKVGALADVSRRVVCNGGRGGVARAR